MRGSEARRLVGDLDDGKNDDGDCVWSCSAEYNLEGSRTLLSTIRLIGREPVVATSVHCCLQERTVREIQFRRGAAARKINRRDALNAFVLILQH